MNAPTAIGPIEHAIARASMVQLPHAPRVVATRFAQLPAFRDAIDYRAWSHDALVVALGPVDSLAGRWLPDAVFLPLRGSLIVTRGAYAQVASPGEALLVEAGARCAYAGAEVFALFVPPASGFAHEALPTYFPGRVDPQSALVAPLQRTARRLAHGIAISRDDATALATTLASLQRSQDAHASAIARCRGRSELHRRKHYLRLLHAKLAIESAHGVGWPLARLARVARMSPTHFLRAFRLAFGLTPHEYQVHVRLTEAHRRIVGTQDPIADIGRALGFNRCAFTRAFRAHFGLAPRDLRVGGAQPAGENP